MRVGSWRAPEVQAAGLLAVLVVGVRLAMTRALLFCGTPDACYYLGMAQNLGSGRGFHARFLYDFQLPHPTLPNTGIEYWRPGISLLLALLKPLGGTTLHGSILITTLVGVLFAAAAWHIAMQAYGDRRLALGSFALCLLSPSGWIGSMSPDSGLYYGAAVAWFLALFTVRRQGLWQDIVALGCVGMAYGMRNDAALLLLPLLVVLWQRHRLATATASTYAAASTHATQPIHATQSTQQRGSVSLPYAAVMVVGFGVALLPMHLLYRSVLGTAFPSGTAQTLWMNDLGDFVRYGEPVSRYTLLAHGLKHLLLFRIETLVTVLYRTAALTVGYAALVFLPGLFLKDRGATPAQGDPLTPALWHRLPELTGAAVFFVAALLAYTLALPAVGGFAALRTAAALMPWIAVLVIVAIMRVARTPRVAWTLTAAVLAANLLGGVMDDRRNVTTMNETGATDRALARQLAALGADPRSARVLTNDPVQFSVTTGYATAALPINGLDAIVGAAHDLRATHVMLNTEDLPATFDELNRHLHPVRSAVLPAEHTVILALPPQSYDD